MCADIALQAVVSECVRVGLLSDTSGNTSAVYFPGSCLALPNQDVSGRWGCIDVVSCSASVSHQAIHCTDVC
jgi:hypothetical protein